MLVAQPAAHDFTPASFTAQTKLVLVPVTVTDRDGKTVTDLKQEHFRITDGSMPREIVSFSRVDTAISMGIVLDLSASMKPKLPYAIGAVQAIARTLGPEDAGYLVTFSHRPELRVGYTRDATELAVNLAFSKAEGNTALFDAVALALDHGRRGKGLRKVLLVVSDGGDNKSRLMAPELVSAALEADTQIYCIAVHERLRAKDEAPGAYFLEKLSNLTGGLKFDVRGMEELAGVAETIALATKEQYLIGFKPVDEVAAARWRKVRVKVNVPGSPSLRVTSRSAYFNP